MSVAIFPRFPMPTETPATTDKQVAVEELAILAAINEGLADIEAGRVVSHEEVKRRSALWSKK